MDAAIPLMQPDVSMIRNCTPRAVPALPGHGVHFLKTAIWQGPRLAIVEDIPAHVCEACLEQFYDDEVSEALRRLSEEGFPAEKASKQIVVPVFSLEGRIVRRPAFPDDTYVD